MAASKLKFRRLRMRSSKTGDKVKKAYDFQETWMREMSLWAARATRDIRKLEASVAALKKKR